MDKIKDQNESINEILVNKLYEELKAKNQNIIDTEKERNPLSKTELASNRLILESFIDHIAIEPLSEDFPTNSDVITEEIDQNLIKANFRYMSFSVIAIGGSALIIKAYDRKLKSYVAIKIPRCPVGLDLLNNISYSSDSEINSFELISNEINYIKYFKNENIIKIINHGSFKIKKVAYQDDIYYYIMDYIKESYDLFEFIKFEIHNFKSNPSTTKSEEFLENVLKILQNIFFQISDAIEYLHNEKIIHFDIKPSNIMVKNESPEKVSALLTDFGLAKKYSLSNEEIKVGFTYFYSHKDLKEKMSQMYSINKASAKFKENELKYTWDIYSLGKTIMHCLAYIEDSFPNYVLQDYFFKYLYFASSRMLDGENLNDAEYKIIISKDSYKIVKFNERYMNITNSTFNNIKYLFAYEIKDDISKINKSEKQEYPYMGIEKIFNDIPIIKNAINIFDNREIYKQYEDDLEIYNNSYDSIINQLINADFGGKCSIEKIIELDAFKNLRKIKQLSMVYKTYFNAKHTRYEHSIGVFCCCCKYIERLLKDSTNPIFIQLFNTEDIKILRHYLFSKYKTKIGTIIM